MGSGATIEARDPLTRGHCQRSLALRSGARTRTRTRRRRHRSTGARRRIAHGGHDDDQVVALPPRSHDAFGDLPDTRHIRDARPTIFLDDDRHALLCRGAPPFPVRLGPPRRSRSRLRRSLGLGLLRPVPSRLFPMLVGPHPHSLSLARWRSLGPQALAARQCLGRLSATEPQIRVFVVDKRSYPNTATTGAWSLVPTSVCTVHAVALAASDALAKT